MADDRAMMLRAFHEIGSFIQDEHMTDTQRVVAIKDVLDELQDDLKALWGEHPMGWAPND